MWSGFSFFQVFQVFLCFRLFWCGSSLIIMPWLRSFNLLAPVLGSYGFCIGFFIVLVPTVLARNHGVDRLPATYGFIRMAMGISNFISPQIMGKSHYFFKRISCYNNYNISYIVKKGFHVSVGLMADIFGDYGYSYGFAGTCVVLSSFVQLRATLSEEALLKCSFWGNKEGEGHGKDTRG